MAEFLDLMAFAKGAELANQSNWKDTMNDITARTGEESLRQSQGLYDLGAPLREMRVGNEIDTFAGNQLAYDFQSSLNKETAGMDPAERAQFSADRVLASLKNMDLTRPENRAYQTGVVNYGMKVVQDLQKLGRADQAALLARSLPGFTGADSMAQAQALAKPGYFSDALMVQSAGGQMLPNGKVSYGNVEMDPLQFQQFKVREASDPNFNPTTALIELDKFNKDMAFQNQVADRAKRLGMEIMINPVNGQRVMVPRAQAMQAAAAGLQLPPGTVPGQTVPGQTVPGQTASGASTQAVSTAPQAAAPGAMPVYAQPAVAGGAAPVYWPDPSGAGLSQAIMAQSNAAPQAGPGWWANLMNAFSGQQPVGVNQGWTNFINPAPAQYVPSQNVYQAPWWMQNTPTGQLPTAPNWATLNGGAR
jgi:hypothetical protein